MAEANAVIKKLAEQLAQAIVAKTIAEVEVEELQNQRIEEKIANSE